MDSNLKLFRQWVWLILSDGGGIITAGQSTIRLVERFVADDEISGAAPNIVGPGEPHFLKGIEQHKLNEQRNGREGEKQEAAAEDVAARAAGHLQPVAVDVAAEGGGVFDVIVGDGGQQFGTVLMVELGGATFDYPSSRHEVDISGA